MWHEPEKEKRTFTKYPTTYMQQRSLAFETLRRIILITCLYNVPQIAGQNTVMPTPKKHFADFHDSISSTFNNKEEAEDKK